MLNKMTIQSIRKLAAAKGADGKGTRASIAARLKALVTEADIWDATPCKYLQTPDFILQTPDFILHLPDFS
jgi:hypothetical protein